METKKSDTKLEELLGEYLSSVMKKHTEFKEAVTNLLNSINIKDKNKQDVVTNEMHKILTEEHVKVEEIVNIQEKLNVLSRILDIKIGDENKLRDLLKSTDKPSEKPQDATKKNSESSDSAENKSKENKGSEMSKQKNESEITAEIEKKLPGLWLEIKSLTILFFNPSLHTVSTALKKIYSDIVIDDPKRSNVVTYARRWYINGGPQIANVDEQDLVRELRNIKKSTQTEKKDHTANIKHHQNDNKSRDHHGKKPSSPEKELENKIIEKLEKLREMISSKGRLRNFFSLDDHYLFQCLRTVYPELTYFEQNENGEERKKELIDLVVQWYDEGSGKNELHLVEKLYELLSEPLKKKENNSSVAKDRQSHSEETSSTEQANKTEENDQSKKDAKPVISFSLGETPNTAKYARAQQKGMPAYLLKYMGVPSAPAPVSHVASEKPTEKEAEKGEKDKKGK
jgi:hypothetical protein